MKSPLSVAKDAALRAGKLILSMQENCKISQKEESFNLVTEADIESEKLISEYIKSSMPDSEILSEESFQTSDLMSKKLWIIDPIDGTNNYAHKLPQFSISIAYAENGIIKSGVVYDPSRDELFSAEAGKGAFLNNKPITVTRNKSISDAIVGTGFYYDRGELMDRTLKTIHHLFDNNIIGIRRIGSAALDLCWVACGRYDAYFEYKLSVWDFAAGLLILNEAGGQFCDRDGVEGSLFSNSVICSNGYLQKKFADIVKWNNVIG